VEIVSRIFKLLPLEDAWSARQVCRHWRGVFDFCASGSEKVYLRGIVVTVDIICGIRSATGKVIDSHFIHGELSLDTSTDNPRDMAKWSSKRRQCEYWPGGRWRRYTIKEALTAVKLMFSNCPWNTPDIVIQIDRNVEIIVDSDPRGGCDDTFTLLIGRANETLPNGRLFENHSIVAVAVPIKKLFPLLVRHTRKSRQVMELFRRHYNFASRRGYTEPEPEPGGQEKFQGCCTALRETFTGFG
jgi:F-box-like